jgi:three-Cys-motif partner protein
MPSNFFNEQLSGSKIKTSIVSKYFLAWANVMVANVRGRGDKIGYLDFFCGPGKYEDGSDSTPLIILKAAVNNPDFSKMLVTIFNDADQANVDILEEEVLKISGIDRLKYQPDFAKETVGNQLAEKLKKLELVPSLIFLDPFGYKGLSLELIASVIKDWGCDCIFFFNYNRINAALTNKKFVGLVNSIFGEETADLLREKVEKLKPEEREELILEYFMEELKKIKGKYSISFKFFKENSSKTSHFIFFTTKHPLGYKIMKQTMATHCATRGGVPTYEYDPKQEMNEQMDLFEDDNSEIQFLAKEIHKLYKGKTKTRKEIYEEHNIRRPYIENNYKDALLLLEQEGKISIDPPAGKRKKMKGKLTLGEKLPIKF